QSAETKYALDPFEWQEPHAQKKKRQRDRDKTAIRPVAEYLPDQCDAADFRGAGEQVDERCGNQRYKTGAEADALANDVEYRLLPDGGYAPGHLAIENDADRSEDQDPQQAVAETHAGVQ